MKIDKKVVFILAFILVLILFIYISPEIKIGLEHKEGYPIDPTSKKSSCTGIQRPCRLFRMF